MDDFERKLQQGLVRMTAPPGLKRKILARKRARDAERSHRRVMLWQRLAAGIVLVASVGGAFTWRAVEQRRKGEAARNQVFVALRIAGHALDQMNAQLAARDSGK
jgi:hypothetical protein